MGRSNREQKAAEAAALREAQEVDPIVTDEELLDPDSVEKELEAEKERDELDDLPEPEEEVDLSTESEVYIFKSKYDFTRKFGKSGTKMVPDGQGGFTPERTSRPIPVRFVNRTGIITDAYAQEFGYTAKDLAAIMRKDAAYLQTFCFFKGPEAVKLTRKEVDFLKNATRTIRKYGAKVVQGAR